MTSMGYFVSMSAVFAASSSPFSSKGTSSQLRSLSSSPGRFSGVCPCLTRISFPIVVLLSSGLRNSALLLFSFLHQKLKFLLGTVIVSHEVQLEGESAARDRTVCQQVY